MQDARQQGFTLVEVLVVLVIVAILSAVAIGSFRGSKDSANRTRVLAVGQTYDQAISSFAADHTGKVPAPGTADWPNPSLAELRRGPREPSTMVGGGGRQPYLRTVPDAVSAGVVTIWPSFTSSPTSGATAPTGSVGVIVYRREAVPAGSPAGTEPVRYRIEVWPARERRLVRSAMCVLGTLPEPGDRRC